MRAYIDDLLPDVLDGRIDPGKVFDRTVGLDGYRAMADRESIKVTVGPRPRRGAPLAVAALASAWTQLARGGAENATSTCPADRGASEPSPRPTQTSPRSTDDMDITLSFDDTELTGALVESETTQDFPSLLPLTRTLSDHNETWNRGTCRQPRRLHRHDHPLGRAAD